MKVLYICPFLAVGTMAFGISDHHHKSPLVRRSNVPLSASTLPKTDKSTKKSESTVGSRFQSSGIASAAAVATAAVNAAVAMRSLEAPDVKKSYIAMEKNYSGALDEDGLPLVYDKDLIEAYWRKERGALNKRWSYFVAKAIPFFTKVVTLFIRDGKITDAEIPALSKQARLDLEDLGPSK